MKLVIIVGDGREGGRSFKGENTKEDEKEVRLTTLMNSFFPNVHSQR